MMLHQTGAASLTRIVTNTEIFPFVDICAFHTELTGNLRTDLTTELLILASRVQFL